ncbi:formimidoylglutamase [Phocicoccus pinnipedialis]|uniref:Formimidoylglutamase n=1 Tax=Phocicoccus pinnipedialis TaxID=110845 RepID=A0A6V7RIU0_9BACL|nr:formimidoylglutamase [Jeotgalicoccus pinnipedialis]MBP1938981.1 formiminoglutamase [Jeotgalicoccus pinnipedialis]CAD2077307.1 Formimidoylglutamase [Jeotgalicoccus pinnipedialis]
MTLKKHSYTGRTDNPSIKERFHQVVKEYSNETNSDVIIGFMSDEGVKRNKGRVGASLGPVKIREKMASLPYIREIFDVGSVVGTTELEVSQAELGNQISNLLKKDNFVLILGGGHETLYGHYLGVRETFKDEKICVLNIDAHFDLRNETSSSGTMFHQILSSDKNIHYKVLGIQPLGNTKTLFETANQFGVEYYTIDKIRENKDLLFTLSTTLQNYDKVFMTLCMDSVKASDAPGVSAPSSNGFTSLEIKTIIEHFAKLNNLVSFDISEVSPEHDRDDMTSALAAFLSVTFLNSKNENV